jgi:hypothetical protein
MKPSDSKALKARIDAVRRARSVEPEKAQAQLEIWPERVRALPNALARCALFTAAGKREARRPLQRERLVSLADIEVSYTGQELRQDDQDVWLQVVHMARTEAVGNHVELTGHSLLSALGWGRGADRYERVRASIQRMTEATIWISSPGRVHGWSGRLIGEFAWRDEDGEGSAAWRVKLDPKIVSLFAPQDVSWVEWTQRLKLKPLAKWLHGFYCTHREPHPYRVATLHQLCGSRATRIANFRNDVKKSLDELVKEGFLKEWSHDPRGDTISVVRRPRQVALSAS